MPTVHLLIKGKVQGVFYRATAKKTADEFGVAGWVQNTAGGHVEIVATAPKEALDKFVEWCHKGPCRAQVSDIEIVEQAEQSFAEFQVKRK